MIHLQTIHSTTSQTPPVGALSRFIFYSDLLSRRTTKKITNTLTEYIYSGNDVIEETMSTVNPTTQAKTKKELREYVYGSKGMTIYSP